jgi:hypothetical protein
MHELRNPRLAAPNAVMDSANKGGNRTTGQMIQTPSNGPHSLLDGSRRQTTEVAILDLLARRENTDMRFIEASRLF